MTARAPLIQTFGMKLSFDDKGRSIFRMPYNPALDHAAGSTHGGAISALIDVTGWFAAALRFNHWIATVEFNTRLLEPATKEELIGTGEVVRAGKRLAVVQVRVETSAGKLVAIGSGTFTVTSIPRP